MEAEPIELRPIGVAWIVVAPEYAEALAGIGAGDALDGTPVLDLKPALSADVEAR